MTVTPTPDRPLSAGSSRRAASLTGLRALAVVCALALGAQVAAAAPQHGIAMHGKPALEAGFTHLPYANPEAPKGGRITYGVQGSFDSTNPFIVKGVAARGLWDFEYGNNVYESLLTRNRDEAFSLYGLIAESVEVPDDRSWVEFRLRPEARFSDGTPITADDVIFSVELLREHGRPHYRSWYKKVERLESPDAHTVRFVFKDGTDRELPLLIGLAPILPKHATDPETFERSNLDTPLGSGPYTVAALDPGGHIVLTRDENYWGKDLAVKAGHDNFDEIRIDYYRDHNSLFEAFKKGLVHLMVEKDPARWAQAYDFPAVTDGRVVRDTLENAMPQGMLGMVYNTRRPVFSDPLVRQALQHLLDFEWLNQNLYFGLYERTHGYFDGSFLSSIGRPASAEEQALLAPFPGAVRPDVMQGAWRAPTSDGSGSDRGALRAAVTLLKQAGYAIDGGVMTQTSSTAPLTFEILTKNKDEERLALAFERTLARIGIAVTIRTVDSAQYERRRIAYDYDMTFNYWPVSLSPGNEQSFRWSSASAEQDGTFNFAGAHEPAIDAMIDAMLAARTEEQFTAAVRAFDRVLISGFYVVPLFHLPAEWVARWANIVHPDAAPLTGYRLDTWWSAASEATPTQ
ncbi:ABC transporter substrate-binding protein [Breoghania sp. L-A4]|nr:ABC transporter substrate-binding protein [Breoghania sp. L-A4]